MSYESLNSAKQDHALEQHAAGARLAFACSFSSSDEYYADIITEKRAAGVYGAPWYAGDWYRGPAAGVCAAIVVLAGMLLLL